MDAQVIIAGAGPTGLTTALGLAGHGVASVLVERDAGPQEHPAACILNTRTMEVFRELGVEDEIRQSCQDPFERANVYWVVTLAGRELGRFAALPPDLPAVRALSPTHMTVFPQHRLEPILWERTRRHSLVDFRPGHECVGVSQDDHFVTATLVEPKTGRLVTVRGAYLIACDGASSSVRQSLGIPMTGPVLQDMLGLHFTADLGRYVNHRRGILYWVLNRDLLGVLIAHWLPREWVLLAPYLPPQQTPDGCDERACLGLIHRAVGSRDIPDLVLGHVGRWTLAGQLADTYRRGCVFLAGDAAHTFPPTGGLGLNTGVQDGHNLAWKLAAVLRGAASPALLDTYEFERRPVARRSRDQSVYNFRRMSELTQTAGLDLRWAEMVHALQQSGWFHFLPPTWRLKLVDWARRTALNRLATLDADSPRGDRVRAAFQRRIPGQAEHYCSLGIDLGFAYEQGAVVPEDSRQPAPANPVTEYLPTTRPGARLPHLWVVRNAQRVSVHDILDRSGYTLLTYPEGKSSWQTVLATLQSTLPMPVACVSVGTDAGADVMDCDRTWPQLCQVGPTGAVLVRPDGHVAWRARQLPDSPTDVLQEILRRLR